MTANKRAPDKLEKLDFASREMSFGIPEPHLS
jgi:hypothetical protein